MEKALYAVDELSGFLVACAYVRPEGIVGMTPKSVKKKLKTPAFAAAVNRDDVRNGAEELGVDFDEHVAFVIAALEARADELGLTGTPAAADAVAGAGALPARPARAPRRAGCGLVTTLARMRDRHQRPGDRPVDARARPARSPPRARRPAPHALVLGARQPAPGPPLRPPRPARGDPAADRLARR